MRKTLAAAAFGLGALIAAPVASADDAIFELAPGACEDAIAIYMSERLTDPRAARYRMTSDPYRVLVNMRGDREVSAWAVDVRVKSRLPSGSWSGYQPYTVIFQNGQAVALESDLPDVVRI
ncbi:MAG: hypothetical protein AAGA09_04500 [Pseudomonadota bacterium]